LDEVREADVLIHIVDISHPAFEEQIEVVNQTLTDIGASDKPVIMLFNKIDLYSHVKKDEDDLTPVQKENLTLKDLENTWMAKNHLPSIFISATEKTNLGILKEIIYEEVLKIRKLRYPSLS
jgi:GTP-binding protein HflX